MGMLTPVWPKPLGQAPGSKNIHKATRLKSEKRLRCSLAVIFEFCISSLIFQYIMRIKDIYNRVS